MRTMFIVLIWWLVVFTTAEPPAMRTEKDCGGIFKCFVPESCISTSGVTTLGASSVKEITVDNKKPPEIFENCPAIIRFYAYAKYWLHVEIESFASSTTAIVFSRKNSLEKTIGSEFSCVNGSSRWEEKYSPQPAEVRQVTDGVYEKPSKLLCKFEVVLEDNDQTIFRTENRDHIQFKIGAEETIGRALDFVITLDSYCDPSKFNYHVEQPDNTKIYKKLGYKPGEYSCGKQKGDEFYKIEYRVEPSVKYKEDVKFACQNSIFAMDGVEITTVDEFDIRCVADAKFFCEYDVKIVSNKKGPVRKSTSLGNTLKCPDNYPHLIIDDQPLPYPKFNCLNYGSSTFWTVNGNYLTEDGPEVYCTNEVKCHLLNSIFESSVEGGTLDNDFLPICFDTGSLYTDGKTVIATRCDKLSGQFKFTVDGVEDVIHNTTKFYCEYPEVKVADAQKNEENTNKIMNSLFIGIGVSLGIVFLLLATFAICMVYGLRKAKKEAQLAQNEQWIKYSLNPEEKAAYEVSSSSSVRNEEICDWKEMIMSIRCKSWGGISTPDQDGGHIDLESEEAPDFSDAPERSNKVGLTHLNMKKYSAGRSNSLIGKGVEELSNFYVNKARKELRDEQAAMKKNK